MGSIRRGFRWLALALAGGVLATYLTWLALGGLSRSREDYLAATRQSDFVAACSSMVDSRADLIEFEGASETLLYQKPCIRVIEGREAYLRLPAEIRSLSPSYVEIGESHVMLVWTGPLGRSIMAISINRGNDGSFSSDFCSLVE